MILGLRLIQRVCMTCCLYGAEQDSMIQDITKKIIIGLILFLNIEGGE